MQSWTLSSEKGQMNTKQRESAKRRERASNGKPEQMLYQQKKSLAGYS